MNLNKKVLLITMTVICIAWVYNLVIFMGSQTEKPLFFRQDTYVEDDGIIEIMYLEKKQLDGDIVSIGFPEISDKKIMNFGRSGTGENNTMFNKLCIVLRDEKIYDDLNIKNSLKNGDIKLSKIRYTTSTGKEEEASIGNITIGKKFENGKPYKILEQFGGETRSDNSGKDIYKAKDDLKILAVESESLDEINKFFDVYINTEKLEYNQFPINLQESRVIEVYYEAKKGLKDSDFNVEQYNMQLKLKCSDPEGTIDYITTNLKIDIGINNSVTKASFIRKLNNRLEEN